MTNTLTPLQKAAHAIKHLRSQLDALQQRAREPIAIIGLDCRFPHANNPAEFWELLRDGRDAMREVPADRWDIDALYDPDPAAEGKMYVREAGFVDGIDQFDAQFFGIAPREAIGMDPQQRLLLEVSYHALEHAGQAPDQLRDTPTGVFVGVSFDDYLQISLPHNDPVNLDTYTALGNYHSVAAGRIAYTLGLQGPAMQLDTACSSSLLAVHLAVQSLRRGECDMALAGGVNLMLSPVPTIGFCKLRALAPDGRCKTFSAEANGYARGEGCGIVVLKRLSDAQASGDNVLAVIRGSAVNHDGASSGLTVPNQQAQEKLIRQALRDGDVAPHEVGYVEAHGTGTLLGDPIEIAALQNALNQQREQPLYVGSVKTNIGHLESAAGIAALIKTVLALQHQTIPPHLHFDTPNPHIGWNQTRVPTELTAWDGQRIAGVSSFGISGTNVHLVVGDAPEQEVGLFRKSPTSHILTISAKTEAGLRERIAQMQMVLATSEAALEDICFTANAGRAHFEKRVIVTGRTREEVRTGLASAEIHTPTTQPTIAFLFDDTVRTVDPAITHPAYRAAVEQCRAMPPAFVAQYALAMVWQAWGVEPAAVVGRGVGEYVAACVAGIMDVATAGRLLNGTANGHLTLNAPQIDFVSSRTGAVANRDVTTVAYWQLRGDAWGEAIASAEKTIGCDLLLTMQNGVVPQIALLYQRGATLNWSAIQTGKRIPLPTYPFQRKRYWVQPKAVTPQPTPDAHPLLGKRIRSAAFRNGEIVFESQLTANQPTYLRHHTVFGNTVLLGAAYLDMALSAAQTVAPHASLSDVAIQRALLLDDTPTTVQTILTPNGDDRWQFEVVSEQGETWHVHAAGEVVANAPALREEIGEWRRVQMGEGISAEIYYQQLDRNGLTYGENLQGIQQLWMAGDTALGDIKLPAPSADPYQLHPALLDSALQVVMTVLPDETAYMPVAIERVVLYRRPTARLWSYVKRRPAQQDKTYTLDVTLLTPEGEAIAAIYGLQAKRASATALNQQDAIWRDWLYAVEWRPQALPHVAKPTELMPSVSAVPQGGMKPHLTDYTQLITQLDAISAGYVQQALGANWRTGDRFTTTQLMAQTGILDRYHALTERLLMMLVEDGWLERRSGAWCVVRVEDVVLDVPQSLREQHPAANAELTLLQRCGERLVAVLRGEQDPLDLLFPAGDLSTTTQFYRQSPATLAMNQLCEAALIAATPASTVPAEPYRLEIMERGSLEQVRLNPSARRAPAPDEVEIEVQAAALNFRDLLNVLGMYPGDAGQIGGECAGVIVAVGAGVTEWQVGDGVMALGSGCFGRYLTTPATHLLPKPPHLTSTEAATIPIAFLTAYYGLHTLANIRAGDRVLIHAATGGVGMAAVQLAQRAGAEVYATASPAKWDTLRQMGVTHIYNSRTVEFAAQIRRDTAGQGVNIILNSLTGDGFIEANLAALSADGYLIELSKRGAWDADQVAAQHPTARYTAFDIAAVVAQQPALLPTFAAQLPTLQPLPSTTFPIDQATAALRLMQQAQHIGKVVLTMPQSGATQPLRILEIGAGTGGTTAGILPHLRGCNVEYHFTDLSPHFLNRAQEQFAAYPFVRYSTLDIEQSPAKQGFAADYDIIIAANVLHATKNLRQALTHARSLLRRDGLLVLLEGTAPQRWVDLTFGLTDGWWRFDDDVRSDYPLIDEGAWRDLLAETGFGDVATTAPYPALKQALIVAQTVGQPERWAIVGEHPAFVDELRRRGEFVVASADFSNTDRVVAIETTPKTTLKLVQALAQTVNPPQLTLLTNFDNPDQATVWGMGKTIALEHPELNCLCLDVDDVAAAIATIQRESAETAIRLREGNCAVARLARYQPQPANQLTIRPDHGYLITGGTGGLGLAVADWLAGQGARFVTLIARNAPSPTAQKQIDALETQGVQVTVAQADVAERDQLARVLNRLDKPLAGVIHAAGTLADGLLVQQTAGQFERVFRPKIQGAKYLHTLTQHQPLDFFVLFSSAASLLGSAGQANHAAANAYLDALAHQRRANGLPALSINWGAWSEIGSAADRQAQVAALGMGGIAPQDGIAVFEHLLTTQAPAQVGVVPIDWSRFDRRAPFFADFGDRELSSSFGSAETQPATPDQSNIRVQLDALLPGQRYEQIEQVVSQLVGQVLAMSAAEVSTTTGFFNLGMDSLTSVELRTLVQKRFAVSVPSTLAFDYPTVTAIADYLLEKLGYVTADEVEEPSFEVVETTVEEDLDALSADQLADLLTAELVL